MSDQRKEYLLKLARGKNFRSALKAVAELRTMNDAGLASAVAQGKAPDEQREFQRRVARVVLEKGVEGLVLEWPVLGEAKWRAELISEIGQFLHLWAYPATVELGLAALEDPSREVQIKSIWMFLGFVREPSAKERKPEKTESGRRYQEAANTLRGWITPAHRSRMTRGFTAMLERHRREPYPVLPEVVELIGYTANKEDLQAIALLEELRLKSGEPYRVSAERVDKSRFEWFENWRWQKKGPLRRKWSESNTPRPDYWTRNCSKRAWPGSESARREPAAPAQFLRSLARLPPVLP